MKSVRGKYIKHHHHPVNPVVNPVVALVDQVVIALKVVIVHAVPVVHPVLSLVLIYVFQVQEIQM